MHPRTLSSFKPRLYPFSSHSSNALHTLATPPPQHSRRLAQSIQDRARQRIADLDRLSHPIPVLVDTFNRKHDYLRISLTERCNLRCFYCMPPEGIQLSPKPSILSDDEIIRLATLFVKNGIKKIRLTGGEPTIRKNIIQIVASLNSLRQYGLQAIAMTSNGLALHRKLPELVDNGLSHLNLSLDTLDPFKFELMTRRLGHDAVLRTLHTALDNPKLTSVKLNVVVVRGMNDMEVLQFIELTKNSKLSVRFIEFMPFSGNSWDKRKMISSGELLERISAIHPGVQKVTDELNDTARSYQVPGYTGTFGFISSMSNHFCNTCNRLRLTADGQIKVCLFDDKEVSLRDRMRNGASDSELLGVIRRALRQKKEKHAEMEEIDVVKNRPMILIGVVHHRKPREPSKNFSTTVSAMDIRSPMSTGFNFPRPRSWKSGLRYFSSMSSYSDIKRLTHIDGSGKPNMVDVSSKQDTSRSATATGCIYIPKAAYELVAEPASGPSADHHHHQNGADLNDNLGYLKQKARQKGNVLVTAQLAGIMAAKRTSDIIPLCHQIPLSNVSLTLTVHTDVLDQTKGNTESASTRGEQIPSNPARSMVSDEEGNRRMYYIRASATTRCHGKTGVEMEALTAVSASLLTVWDMLKAVAGKEMIIGDIYVSHKSGGKSGDFTRHE